MRAGFTAAEATNVGYARLAARRGCMAGARDQPQDGPEVAQARQRRGQPDGSERGPINGADAADTAVEAEPAFGALAPMFNTLMIRPHRRSTICGQTRRARRIAANSFRSRSACHTASVMVGNAPAYEVPALLTRMSSRPKTRTVSACAAAIFSAFDTSHVTTWTRLFAAACTTSALAPARQPGRGESRRRWPPAGAAWPGSARRPCAGGDRARAAGRRVGRRCRGAPRSTAGR